MSFDYSGFIELAEEKLSEYGTPCKLVFLGKQVYDVKTNSYIYPNKKVYDGNCLVTDYKSHLIDGTVIQSGDREVLATLPEKPIPTQSTLKVYNSNEILVKSYLIINVETIAPNTVDVILYKIQCR